MSCDSDLRSGHVCIPVRSDFFTILLSAVRAFFVQAHCLQAYRIFWRVHTPVLPLMSAALRFSFCFEISWVFLDRPLVFVSQTTSRSALPPPGSDGDLSFRFGAQALLPPELAGETCPEGADSSQMASDMLCRPDAIPGLSILVSHWPSFNQELASLDHVPGTVLGLQM